MLLAELFSPADAAVIIAALIPVVFAAWKMLPSFGTEKIKADVKHLEIEFAKMQTTLKIMFACLVKGGASDILIAGLGTSNSPLKIRPSALILFDSFKDELQAWYKNQTVTNERDLFILLESRFGQRILDGVSTPNKIQYSACLLIAWAVARDTHSIDLPADLLSPEIDESK